MGWQELLSPTFHPPAPVHSIPSPSSVQGPVRHHSQPLALQAPSAEGLVGTLQVGRFPSHASHPHEPVQPCWGLSGGTPSYVHNLCGCPHPVATSPHAALLQCQMAPPVSWGPQQQTLEISSFLFPPLNFNVVVKLSLRGSVWGGSAVPEAWSVWSFVRVRGPEQQDQCGGSAPLSPPWGQGLPE